VGRLERIRRGRLKVLSGATLNSDGRGTKKLRDSGVIGKTDKALSLRILSGQ